MTYCGRRAQEHDTKDLKNNNKFTRAEESVVILLSITNERKFL